MHRSPMQTEISHPSVSLFPALSVDPRVDISRSALETDG